jgi:hypothetical protein
MVEWCNAHKWKKVIQNEVIVHHGYSKPISFRPTHTKVEWLKIKEENKYNDVMFMLLEKTLPKPFFDGKQKLNPSKGSPPRHFVKVVK